MRDTPCPCRNCFNFGDCDDCLFLEDSMYGERENKVKYFNMKCRIGSAADGACEMDIDNI